MPSVAISSVIGSWLTRWRSASRSISQATPIMMAMLTAIASATVTAPGSMPSQPGIHSEKRAIASAANSTIAPCAKLKTPEALKISTKPSATSA